MILREFTRGRSVALSIRGIAQAALGVEPEFASALHIGSRHMPLANRLPKYSDRY